jgi:hypothetical protein
MTADLIVAAASMALIGAGWLAIKWTQASREYRQILCAAIDTSAEDEQ